MGYSAERAQEIWQTYTLFILWNCIISICAGILTIVIMIRLKVYQLRMMAIVMVMTVLQCLYDISLIPQLSGWCGPNGSNEYTKCRTVQVAANLFMGISSAQCTCLSVALIAWVILKRQAVSLNTYWMFALVIVPGLAMGIVYGLAYYDGNTHNSATEAASEIVTDQLWSGQVLAFYDSFRLAQIAFNTLCMLLVLYELRSIKIICVKGASELRSAMSPAAAAASGDSIGSDSSKVSRTAYPMFLLASRLMWYPVAQTLSRIGPAWYHFATGDASSSYRKSVVKTDSPEMMTIQLYAYALTTPLAGLLYFFIFLMMQRGAWTETKMLLTCGWAGGGGGEGDGGGGCSKQDAANLSGSASAYEIEAKAKRRSARITRCKSLRLAKSSGALFDTSSAYVEEAEDDYEYEYGDGDRGEDYSRESEIMDDVIPAASTPSALASASTRPKSLAVSRASLINYKADRTSLFGQGSGKSNVDALLEAHKDDVTNVLASYLDEDELCDLISKQSKQE